MPFNSSKAAGLPPASEATESAGSPAAAGQASSSSPAKPPGSPPSVIKPPTSKIKIPGAIATSPAAKAASQVVPPKAQHPSVTSAPATASLLQAKIKPKASLAQLPKSRSSDDSSTLVPADAPAWDSWEQDTSEALSGLPGNPVPPQSMPPAAAVHASLHQQPSAASTGPTPAAVIAPVRKPPGPPPGLPPHVAQSSKPPADTARQD